MKINELIKELENVKEEHGNLDVEVPNNKHENVEYTWVKDVKQAYLCEKQNYRLCRIETY